MSDRLFFASRSFGYGPKGTAGEMLDPGQVVSLGGFPNDMKLIDYGHLKEVPKRSSLSKCGKCGKDFANDFFLNMHGNKRHSGVSDPAKLEAMAIAEDVRMDNMMPLHINKTPGEVSTGKRGPGRPRRAI